MQDLYLNVPVHHLLSFRKIYLPHGTSVFSFLLAQTEKLLTSDVQAF